MSPRRNRRQGGAAAPTGPQPAPGLERTEPGSDGDWVVRAVPAANATKAYWCPGCDQEIPVGVAHLVAWSAEWPGADDRRHWHSSCWRARARRAPRVRRSRGAPRY
ncbi:MAG TPA: ATP/GTP-binding protein [Streptosporangiaceae bacterium]|nr:ATP/GTP-binding protein [Streptosporangiaceae bacterium]